MNTVCRFAHVRRVRQTQASFSRTAVAVLGAVLAGSLSTASAADPDMGKEVFTLGQITVSATAEDRISPLAPDTLDSEQLRDFSRDGLPESLNLVPGVTMTPGSGSRNETTVSVRGFDRWRVPMLLDGIRVYLPADNRIDFDRFLTPDLAEIQVAKGYVSVINGPDGMGGAINLVTRKPVKPFEAEFRGSLAFSNDGHYNGNTVYANVGTRQEKFYLQAGAEQRDVRGWYLSDDFKPTANEDGGKRDHTDKKDWRVNLKAGFTPNATDEYSLNFVKQEGEKRRAFSVDEAFPVTVWDWPEWNVWSLYWLSHTKLGAKSYIKTRAYYNKFDNTLVSTRASAPTSSAQNWSSVYDDNAMGASVELGTDLVPGHSIKTALHWRRDDHTEWNEYPAITGAAKEPKQNTVEDVMSLAVEETWHVTPKVDLVFGLSRDARFTSKAEEFAAGTKFDQPTADSWATNWQAATIWRYRPTGATHLSISRRTRFPTIFERFSSRFGGATSNPWVKPERSRNIELAIKDQIIPRLAGSVALFHNKVDDAIESVTLLPPHPYAGQSQSQNVGEATYKGVELGLTATPIDTLEIGANYTYIDTKVKRPNAPDVRLDSTPRNKSFIYAKWQPIPKLTVIPALELSDSRSTGTGSYELLSLKIAYQIIKHWEVSLTGRNLLDRNYEASPGYPQEGRNFLLSTRVQF